jgi:hypothetical protein
MRVILGTLAVAAAICLAGPAGAATSTTNATIFNKAATPASTIIVAQRCRCVSGAGTARASAASVGIAGSPTLGRDFHG